MYVLYLRFISQLFRQTEKRTDRQMEKVKEIIVPSYTDREETIQSNSLWAGERHAYLTWVRLAGKCSW